ncbi:unnamed protein product [Ranitomeya imitator]|uniref:Peptidase A1 domain-containing protein n=1 Tax=Ranitomeya imitator TaxID=111125 RepID=A0ABN9L5I2_9NEOB|nr:unnamed protein product [Ranitomeya imitator]
MLTGSLLAIQEYYVNCNNVQSLPPISFTISGVQFSIPPSGYILQINGYCVVGFESTYLPSRNGQPLWILGDVFLRQYYSIYDFGNNQIHLKLFHDLNSLFLII